MASNSFVVKNSLKIEPQSSPTIPDMGDLAVDSDTGRLVYNPGTGVEEVAYITDVQAAGAASGVVYDNSTSGLVGTNVQDAVDELAAQDDALDARVTTNEGDIAAINISLADVADDLAAHIADPTAAHAASAISVSPSGNLASTDVQAGLVELQGDINSINAARGALSGIATLDGSGILTLAQRPSYSKSDVGLGNVDNTSDATKNAAAVTLTNKTISGSANTLSNIARSSIAAGTNNQVVINDGSGLLSGVSPGTANNVLKSNGTAWISGAAPATALTVTAVTTTYTALATDDVLNVTAAASYTLSLPAAASNVGKVYRIVRTDDSPTFTVTIDPNASETIDGVTTWTLVNLGEYVEIVSNGTNWVRTNGSKFYQETRYDTRAGNGTTTNTGIVYFTNNTFSRGTGTPLFTITNSNTLGFYVKALRPCLITATYKAIFTGTGEIYGISVNPSSKTATSVATLAQSEQLIYSDDAARGMAITGRRRLLTNDEVYFHSPNGNIGVTSQFFAYVLAESL